MLIPLAAATSALSVLLASLLLVALGLLAMLLPQARLRRLLRGRDPAALGMCAFAFGLAAIGLLLVALALAGSNLPSAADTDIVTSAWLVAGCGGMLLVAATDLLRTALGFRRMPQFATPALWHARLALSLIARR